MADADQAVLAVLAREAVQIKLRRDTLDDQSDILARTSHATFPLQFVPHYGEAAKLAIESTALSGALRIGAQALHDLHDDVSANAAELSQAVGRYDGVADGADVPGEDFNPPQPPSGAATGAASAAGSAVGSLASAVGPLAGLVTGVALAAGQAAAATQGAPANDGEDKVVDDSTKMAEDVRDEESEHRIAAAAEPEPTGLPAPLPDSVNPQTSPGPSAGQETNVGEGVHVGG